jgi:TRAP-type C4-dicarboxylate transport system permease small subunit
VSALLRAVRLATRAAEAMATIAFAAMFVLFLVGIVMRYATEAPLAWSDELIMVIFLWTVFLTEALVITEREQITFDAIYDIVGERARRIIALLAALAIGGLFLYALPTVVDYIRFLWREKTSAMQWRFDYVFACFAVYWAAVVVRAAARLVRLLGPDWRKAVALAAPDERANLLG